GMQLLSLMQMSIMLSTVIFPPIFLFNRSLTSNISSLSLHDALPISVRIYCIKFHHILYQVSLNFAPRSAIFPPPLDKRLFMLYRSEEHTSELQSRFDLVCRLLLDKKKPHLA